MHVGFLGSDARSTNNTKDNPDMKTLSFAAVTGALFFTSSLAMADLRPGPDCNHDHSHHRGGYVRPGVVVRGPSLSIFPRFVLPSPAVVFAPRAPVVTHRPAVVHARPAAAPVVVTDRDGRDRRPGDGKPTKRKR